MERCIPYLLGTSLFFLITLGQKYEMQGGGNPVVENDGRIVERHDAILDMFQKSLGSTLRRSRRLRALFKPYPNGKRILSDSLPHIQKTRPSFLKTLSDDDQATRLFADIFDADPSDSNGKLVQKICLKFGISRRGNKRDQIKRIKDCLKNNNYCFVSAPSSQGRASIAAGRESVVVQILNNTYKNENVESKSCTKTNNSLSSCFNEEHFGTLNLEKELDKIRTKLFQLLGHFRAKHIGGNSKNYDIELELADSSKIRIEMKVSENKSWNEDKYVWKPWSVGVQFFQGFGIEQLYTREFSDKFKNKWFSIVHAHSKDSGIEMVFNDYWKMVSSCTKTLQKMKSSCSDEAYQFLLKAYKQNGNNPFFEEAFYHQLHQKYLDFESTIDVPDEDKVKHLIREKLQCKDYWLVITKNKLDVIDGFNVLDVVFLKKVKKRKGGVMFRYSVVLEKKRTKEQNEIEVDVKLRWKNKGEAVGTLAFQIE